jgi:hypothetical protein
LKKETQAGHDYPDENEQTCLLSLNDDALGGLCLEIRRDLV